MSKHRKTQKRTSRINFSKAKAEKLTTVTKPVLVGKLLGKSFLFDGEFHYG